MFEVYIKELQGHVRYIYVGGCKRRERFDYLRVKGCERVIATRVRTIYNIYLYICVAVRSPLPPPPPNYDISENAQFVF